MNIEVRRLEAFRRVMDYRSVSRAAAALGISQPAVSGLIRRLEEDVGVALFTRTTRRLEPTAEARFLYREVVQALSGLDRLDGSLKELRDARRGTLTIAAHPAASISWLPKVVAQLTAGRPGVSVRLISRSSEQLRNTPPTHTFDIGMAEAPVEHATIIAKRFQLRCVAVLPRGHALCGERVITPQHLSGLPFIALTRWQATHFEIGRAFSRANASWNVTFECEFFATALSLVANGVGVSVCEPVGAAEFAPDLVTLRPFEPAIIYEVAVFHNADRPLSLLGSEFLALLSERLSVPAAPS